MDALLDGLAKKVSGLAIDSELRSKLNAVVSQNLPQAAAALSWVEASPSLSSIGSAVGDKVSIHQKYDYEELCPVHCMCQCF